MGPTKTTCDSGFPPNISSVHEKTIDAESLSPLRGATTYVGHSNTFRDPMII